MHAVKGVDLQIKQGEFFTMLGPSGCGKTTTLRMIAGFEFPTSGEIYLNGELSNEVPPYKRAVNTVFQSYALFPHLSVAQNVGFGLAVKRVPKGEREVRVREALELVKLGQLGERKPNQLSGGQQQRVALARALVNRPAVLLLDEPLGALDLKLRESMQHELKELQKRVGITFIYVTHDQEEALTMSDRIAVMSEGRVQQVGTPEQIYNFPANHFVADFIGDTNFLEGKVVSMHEDRTVLKVGREDVTAAPANFPLMPGEKVTMVIRPEKLGIARELAPNLAPGAEVPAPAAPSNPAKPPQPRINAVMNARVLDSVFVGTDTRVEVTLKGGTELTVLVRNLDEDEEFKKGEKVVLTYDAIDSRLLPAAQLGTTEETYSGATPPPTSEPEKK
ncbi:MAG: ABC transporter ATP-binding protein [Anaerolineales bacterium]|nr:ABC transporter ATP-binding protein [Anaerolineales bacterium]MBX3006046.1 ABC transporter ATP-binding protein [Anaerolineales bacterium]MCW5838956.1 ABC transporter ATP-binding protein [Anaerolineales bacterium]